MAFSVFVVYWWNFTIKINNVNGVHYVKLEAVPKETYYFWDLRVRMC